MARKSWNFSSSPMRRILKSFIASIESNVSKTNLYDGSSYVIPSDPLVHSLLSINLEQLRFWLIVFAGVVLFILTAGGNLLVLLSFKIDKRLRTISNYFLFSLAIADLVVGIVSIPLMTAYTAQREWTLGWLVCCICVV